MTRERLFEAADHLADLGLGRIADCDNPRVRDRYKGDPARLAYRRKCGETAIEIAERLRRRAEQMRGHEAVEA